MDPRFLGLADVLVNFSTQVKPGENVVIECFDVPLLMIEALIDAVCRAGGQPTVWNKSWVTLRAILRHEPKQAVMLAAQAELAILRQAQVYIGIRAAQGAEELASVPLAGRELFRAHWLGPVHYGYRVQHTRWCSAKWPTQYLADNAGLSLAAFEDYYFRVCLEVDYPALRQAMTPLVELINQTDRVRITGPETDISFSIKGIGGVGHAGNRNFPDGEVFTAPVRDSINGVISYNVPSAFQGTNFNAVRLEVLNGRIVAASCQDETQALLTLLATDEGASHFGEFAFGLNPLIDRPIGDTMFDEKMTGSLHLTPGNSYELACNGNVSSVHWDLILSQSPCDGGGDVYFDGRLIRHDGQFVVPELLPLNPTALIHSASS